MDATHTPDSNTNAAAPLSNHMEADLAHFACDEDSDTSATTQATTAHSEEQIQDDGHAHVMAPLRKGGHMHTHTTPDVLGMCDNARHDMTGRMLAYSITKYPVSGCLFRECPMSVVCCPECSAQLNICASHLPCSYRTQDANAVRTWCCRI